MSRKVRTYRPKIKTSLRKQRSAHKKQNKKSGSTNDGSGGVLVILLILWWLGFVSFHLPSTKKTYRRLEEVKQEIVEAQENLGKLQTNIEDTKEAIEPLVARKEEIESQISHLEETRTALSKKLTNVSKLIDDSSGNSGQWYTWFTNIWNSVVANVIWALVILGILVFRRFVIKRHASVGTTQESN